MIYTAHFASMIRTNPKTRRGDLTLLSASRILAVDVAKVSLLCVVYFNSDSRNLGRHSCRQRDAERHGSDSACSYGKGCEYDEPHERERHGKAPGPHRQDDGSASRFGIARISRGVLGADSEEVVSNSEAC